MCGRARTQFRLDVVGRRAAGRVQRHRPGLGHAGLPLGRRRAHDDFRWLRERARRSADLYDGYPRRSPRRLLSHLRLAATETPSRSSRPPNEPDQLALGERVLAVFRESGAEIIAEDLGIVPDFVRASLARLGVPGFRVFRWERHWHVEGQPFRDPSEYPALSVAVSGTHDTETVAAWWAGASEQERRQISDLPTVARIAGGALPFTAGTCGPAVRDVLLETLFASGSDLVLLPVQDVFGWRDRINEPATVNDRNWTFRLPWPVDRLDDVPEARERSARLREWSQKHGRI